MGINGENQCTIINKEGDLGEKTPSFANPRHRGVPVARKRMDLYSSVHQYVINGEMGMEGST